MKVEQINNPDLARFLDSHPEATVQQVIDFCEENILEEIKDFIMRNRVELDFDTRYRSKIQDAISYKSGMRNHDMLADEAAETYQQIANQVSQLLEVHDYELFEKIRREISEKIDELRNIRPSLTTEVPMMMGMEAADRQKEEDRDASLKLEEKADKARQEILLQFKRIELDLDRNYELKRLLRKSEGMLSEELNRALASKDDRVLDELDMICHKYMSMIQEAIQETAREMEEQENGEKVEEITPEGGEELEVEAKAEAEVKTELESEVRETEPEEIESEAEKNEQLQAEEFSHDATIEENNAENPEQLSVAKKVDSKLLELESNLLKFRFLITTKMVEGLSLEDAMKEAQRIVLQDAQNEIEQRKNEPQKSGLEDVIADPNVKSSDVNQAFQAISQQRQEAQKQTEQKKEEIDYENPFR